MPPKPTCFTKERNDKSLYTTCVEGQKKPKKQKLKIVAKGTHKMADGTVMSGKTHDKDSKPVSKPKKKKLIIVEPKPKKKKLIIKKKEPKVSEAQKKKDAMNKLSPLELFGQLPQELRKKIVTPKETGIKVGVTPVSSFTYDDIVEPGHLDADNNLVYEAEENYKDSGGGDIDWIKGITSNQADWYSRHHWRNDLTHQQEMKREKIEFKIMTGLYPTIVRDMTKEFKEWKAANKGKKMSYKEAVKSFKQSSIYF